MGKHNCTCSKPGNTPEDRIERLDKKVKKNKLEIMKRLNKKLSYTLYFVLVALFFTSCHNHINEYTVVTEVQAYKTGNTKYRVELDFNFATQYLYTNETYQVGDTLYLSKKYCN